ncbi:Uncharacterised protein [Ectopseudomonas mendocina]|uniref:XRE family transcriptional regulator n=1 Tax=Ectopseudomonas mendocina TaxID=300 RepID=A0A379PLJ5_ECTME|nr:hypothetical protein [Pseudomonas mendocina]SUE95840.1 Uncharacterised protein [Pseudomonas mendocina]
MSRQARVVIKSETADLVRQMIEDQFDKTQEEIALETGFVRANVLTMIKQGRTKMPLDKIEAFAKSCGQKPDKLLRTALREYAPEVARLVGRVQKVPMFENADQVIDVFNTALTEVLSEVKKEHRDVAENPAEMSQVLRLNASLDLSLAKTTLLKKFIKQNLIKVMAGEEEVKKFPS